MVLNSLDNLNKQYKVIYADPPWYFKSYSKKGEGRNATKHYQCLNLSDIISLPIKRIAENDATLLMWVTDPFLQKAFEVIEGWGFTYKTVAFTWVKTNKKSPGYFTGLGYWTRSNPEMCLLATKGKPKRMASDVQQLVVSKLREHSRKPDEMYDKVERLLEGPYIELFARNKRDNWDSWGNEVDKHG
jgi:N6-adenosine-specific RNA methylase IME4